MGTWQVGPFDNDDAMDFFDEVEETPDADVPPKLRKALVAIVERPGQVELAEGHVAVAAASLVGETSLETIEPDVSSSNTQGTRGSGLSANSLASKPAYSIWSLIGSHLAWGFLNFLDR